MWKAKQNILEYGFLIVYKGKYRCNILIDEPVNELVTLHDNMYSNAAKIFANELFDKLIKSGLTNDKKTFADKQINRFQ